MKNQVWKILWRDYYNGIFCLRKGVIGINIVLIQCNWNNIENIYPNLASLVPYQPTELCYIAPLLKEHNIKIIDAFLDDLSYSRIGKMVADFQADAILLDTANTYLFWRCCYLNIDIVRDTIKSIRKTCNAKCIIFGPHGTVEPKWALKKTGADFVIRGEPEFSVSDFINSNFDESTLGVVSMDHLDNGIAEVTDLDALPIPDYSSLKMERYKGHAWLNEKDLLRHGALIEYSRGCPFYCSFCFRNGFRDKFRMKSAERVIREISYINEMYKINYFFFIDEMFNVDNENFRKLLLGLKELDIKYGCQCRPDVMSKEIIDLMSESGCIYIEYGLESINKEMRERIGKNLNIKKSISMINYSKNKIQNVVYNFLDFSTIDLIIADSTMQSEKVNGSFGFYSDTKALENIVFYPGTELFNELKKKLDTKYGGWDLSVRLYWLSVKLSQNREKSIWKREIWKYVLLHYPMIIIKFLMSFHCLYTPLEISYGHKKDERSTRDVNRKKHKKN